MMRRFLISLLLAGVCAAQTPEELRSLMRQVAKHLDESNDRLDEYGFLRTIVRRDLNSNGASKAEHTFVARRDFVEGFPFIRQLERDGKPVSADEQQRSEEVIQKRLAELKAMSPDELRKLREDDVRRIETRDSWWKEFPEALEFRKVGEESVNGRPALVLSFSPRPGYKPKDLRARFAAKLRGKVWIDQSDTEFVRADAEVFEPVSIGWGVVGKVDKGARMTLERHKTADGAWVPDSQMTRFIARLLVKTWGQEQTTRYAEYHRKPGPPVAAAGTR